MRATKRLFCKKGIISSPSCLLPPFPKPPPASPIKDIIYTIPSLKQESHGIITKKKVVFVSVPSLSKRDS